jgi:hypothetical protein
LRERAYSLLLETRRVVVRGPLAFNLVTRPSFTDCIVKGYRIFDPKTEVQVECRDVGYVKKVKGRRPQTLTGRREVPKYTVEMLHPQQA